MKPVLNPQPGAKQPQTPSLAYTVGRKTNSAEKWQIATRKTNKRKKTASKPEVPLQNCKEILQTEKGKETASELS